jgi:hypothetical protein
MHALNVETHALWYIVHYCAMLWKASLYENEIAWLSSNLTISTFFRWHFVHLNIFSVNQKCERLAAIQIMAVNWRNIGMITIITEWPA